MKKGDMVKKEVHYGVKIACAMYGIILYLYVPMLVEKVLGHELSKNMSTTISLLIAAVLCFWFLPQVIGVPKRGTVKSNLNIIGFTLPTAWPKHIVLGVILAGCTLGGMLIGSMLTGLYSFNVNTISLEQTYFSILPGTFEEIIFRGFVMFIFLDLYKSTKKAAMIQCVIFVILHIGSFSIDPLKFVDLLGVFVLAITFTYVVYKTRNLLAAIIFHILHDAFLFAVQPSQEITVDLRTILPLYISLFIFAGVAMIITKYFSEKLQVREDKELYVPFI